MSLFLLHFWRTLLLSIVFLIGILKISAVWMYLPTSSRPARFLQRKPPISLWGFSSIWWVIFLCCFQNSLSLTFNILIIMYLGVIFSGLILLDVHWTSCTWMFISLPGFGKFSAIVSLTMLSVSFSLFFSGTPVIQMLVSLMVSHTLCRLHLLFFIFPLTG